LRAVAAPDLLIAPTDRHSTEDEMMRSRDRSRPRSVRGVSVLFCAASLFAGGAVLAQPAEDDDLPPGPREFQDPAARELEDARRALEEAQRNFEEAVRETQTRDRDRSAARDEAA